MDPEVAANVRVIALCRITTSYNIFCSNGWKDISYHGKHANDLVRLFATVDLNRTMCLALRRFYFGKYYTLFRIKSFK